MITPQRKEVENQKVVNNEMFFPVENDGVLDLSGSASRSCEGTSHEPPKFGFWEKYSALSMMEQMLKQ